MTKTSGTCADLPERIYNADTPDDPACTGPVTVSPDMCEETGDRTCVDADKTTVITRGKVTWNADGTVGKGTLYLEVNGPAGICTGIYNMNLTRL